MTPKRLNTSFGSIAYTDNNRYSNYESVYFEFKGRFSRNGFIDASYTRSKSQDDASVYPRADPASYYGASPWDVPNRFSLTLNYELPGLNGGKGFAGHATGGWGISGTSIFQSGYPAMVTNNAPFIAQCQDGTTSASNPTGCPSASNRIVTGAPGSGDYNADGDTTGVAGVGIDYPNVMSYHQGNSKSAFLNGAFTSGQFATPTFGTEGDEKANQFRSPNFAETDLNLLQGHVYH